MKRLSLWLVTALLWLLALAAVAIPAIAQSSPTPTPIPLKSVNCVPIFNINSQPVTLCGPALLPVTVYTPTPVPTVAPTRGPLTVTPSIIVFGGPTSTPTTAAISDPLYAGTFTITSNACVSTSISGSTITLTPVSVCTVNFTVSENTPSPLSTVLPVTVQATPVPSPTPTPTPTATPTPGVSPTPTATPTATPTPNIYLYDKTSCQTYSAPIGSCVWPLGTPPPNNTMLAIGQANSAAAITPPSGWTALFAQTSNSADCYQSVGVWYKIAGASEPSSMTWTTTAGVNINISLLSFSSGGTIPTVAQACAYSSSSLITSSTTGTQTPATNFSEVIAGFVAQNSYTAMSQATGYTQQITQQAGSGFYNMVETGNSLTFGTATPVPAISTTMTGTGSNGYTNGFQILLPNPTPGPIVLTPTSYTFPLSTSPGQSVTIAETYYTGSFTATPPPGAPVAVTVSGNSMTVAPNAVGTGTGTIAVSNGTQSANFTYTVSATPTPVPSATPNGAITITGQDFPQTANNTLNLTTLTGGAAAAGNCWAAYGYGTSLFDTKTSCAGILTNVTAINGTLSAGGYNPPPTLTWTDGTPDTASTGTTYPQMVTTGVGNGFSIQVNAGTSSAAYKNTVNIALGNYCSNVTLTAKTSDSVPVPIATDTSYSNVGTAPNSNHLYHILYSTTASTSYLTITGQIASNACGSGTPATSIQWASFTPTTAPIPTVPPATPGPLAIAPASETLPGPTSTPTTAAISDPGNTTAFTITNTNGTSATATITGSTSTGTLTITPTGGSNSGTTTFTVSDGYNTATNSVTVNPTTSTPTPAPFLTIAPYAGYNGTATPYSITMAQTPSSMSGFVTVKANTTTAGSQIFSIVSSLSFNGGTGDASTDALAGKDAKIYLNSTSAQIGPPNNLTAGSTYGLGFTIDAPNNLLTYYLCPFPSKTCTAYSTTTASGVTYGTGAQSLQVGSADAAGTVRVSNFDLWGGQLTVGTFNATQMQALATAAIADPIPSPTPTSTPAPGLPQYVASISTSYTDANPPPYNWRPRTILPTWGSSANKTLLSSIAPDAQHNNWPLLCSEGIVTCNGSGDPPYTVEDGNGGQNMAQKQWGSGTPGILLRICPGNGYYPTTSGGYAGNSNCNPSGNSEYGYGIYFTGDGAHSPSGSTIVGVTMHCTIYNAGQCGWNGSASVPNANGTTQYLPQYAVPQGACANGTGDCHLFELDEYNQMENECWNSSGFTNHGGSAAQIYPTTANSGQTYYCGSYSRGPLNIDEQGYPGPNNFPSTGAPFSGSAFGDEAIGNLLRPEDLVQASVNPLTAITHAIGASFSNGHNTAVWPSGHYDGCGSALTNNGYEGMTYYLDTAGYNAAKASWQAGNQSNIWMAFMAGLHNYGILVAESSYTGNCNAPIFTNFLVWGSGNYTAAGVTSPWDAIINNNNFTKGSYSVNQTGNTSTGQALWATFHLGAPGSGYDITHIHVVNMACPYYVFYGVQPDTSKSAGDSCPHP